MIPMVETADDMILLAEVAEAQSFTQAGTQLGLPKSTVSQRIARLEERLGLRLLNRSTRHVSLTSAGQVYLEHCRRVRAEARAAAMAMETLKDQPVGTLRITCPEITASHFMPAFLHGFTLAYPGIAVHLIATNRPLDIIGERVDFAFRVGAVTGQNLITRRLSAIRRVLVAAPDYLETAPPLRAPDDLHHHRCLLQDGMPDWEFQHDETRTTLSPPAATRSDSMGFLLQSAVAGSGIAMLPAYVCHPALRTNRLVQVLPDWTITPHQMVLVFPNLKNQSRAQAAFRQHVNGYDFSPLSGPAPGTGRA